MYVYIRYTYIYIYIRDTSILYQGYISSRNASKASSTMDGTGEKHVIWHFESKYDKYCIFLCEVFLFFPHSKEKIQDYSNLGLC